MDDFSEWLRHFRHSRRGREALEALEKLDSPGRPELYPYFEHFCLFECHKAATGAYDWRKDAIATARSYQADKAAEAAEILARFLEQHDAARMALWRAGARVIERELAKGSKRGGGTGELIGFVHAVIEELGAALKETSSRDPNVGSGLDYGKSIMNQARTPNSFALDALVFRLTYHCLNWTGIGRINVMSPGRSMPVHGRPCSAAVTAMVNATLGT